MTVPVHDVVVTDDLAAVLPFATVRRRVDHGTRRDQAALNTEAQQLIWTVGTVPVRAPR